MPILISACAQVSPLDGGPKDIFAPSIDSAKSFPSNGQINFDGNQVELKFNEYIRLNKPSENILIIPQMENAPTIEAKNKKLIISFNEELAENTTYTITFNGAVQDITEKNDSVFQYVFSTGNYIDSLQVRGIIKDAFTNKPIEGMLVGLYPKTLETNFDSIPIKFKPTYLVQSDKAGKFLLNYLKSGTYYILAIGDKNRNLKYDKDEQIAFIGEQDFLLNANNMPSFELYAFKEKGNEVKVENFRFTYPGVIEVILSNQTDSFDLSASLPLWQEETGKTDSLIFWLDQKPVPKMKFYLNLNGELDTLRPVYSKIPDKEESVKLTQKNNVTNGKLLPSENLIFIFSEPVKNVDKGGIHIFDIDSNEIDLLDFTVNVREINFESFGTKAHNIKIDSAAVTSVFGRVNPEGINLIFDNETEDYYGSIVVSSDTTFAEPVLLHLINDKGELISSVNFEPKVVFEKLLPGNYQLRLIFDVNQNGEWTSGSYSEAIEPERVLYNSEVIKVKSKWEKEIDWIFKK